MEFAVAYAPSTYGPLPASPALNPLGSSAVVVLPCVITVTFFMYGERVVTSKSVAKRNEYPLSGNTRVPPLQLNVNPDKNTSTPVPASTLVPLWKTVNTPVLST